MHEMAPLEDISPRSAAQPPHRHHQPGRSRVLRSLLAGLLVFAAAEFFSRALDSPTSERGTALVVHQANAWRDPLFYTTDCANPQTAAVVQGVDLVEYFSLQTGEPAVAGKADLAVMHEGYRFLFSTADNKAIFEVSIERATSF